MSDQATMGVGPAPTLVAKAKNSIQTTATVGLAAAAGGETIDWVIDCIQAHALLPPSHGLTMSWAGALAPFVHIIGRIILNRLNKLDPGES